ncbi:maestro heat-like repeat-containing protein family member 2A [Vipera latastei]
MTILQQDKGSIWEKVTIYRSLRAMLERGLEVEPASSFVLTALKQVRASLLEVPRELQVAVSNALASFARQHFNVIMNELQRHLRPFVQPDEFTLLTLGKITAMNVYNCVPFFGITLTTMQTVTRRIEDTRRRWALCTALKQICKAIQIYLRTWERSSYPRISVQQFSIYLLPLYSCITRTWLPGSHSKVRLAVLKALSPMLSILLPRKEFQTQIYDDIILLSLQYDNSSTEAFYISKICSREQKEHLQWQSHHSVEIRQLFLKLARLHPSELLGFFLRKQEESQEDVRVVVLLLLSEIVEAQLPEVWNRRLLCVKVVKAVLVDDSTLVCLATLQAIRKLLSVGYLEKIEGWPLNYIALQLAKSAHQLQPLLLFRMCKPWYGWISHFLFQTYPTWSLPLGGLNEKAMERVSVDLLHFAVTSGRGASQELWKKLLNYLMQPHYTSLATPLCQALRLLAEHRLRWIVPTQATLEPAVTALAVCPLERDGQGTAALLLLSALRPEFYKDVGEHWWVEVPLLVHYLEGHSKYTLTPAAWEQKLLEFLKKSLQRNQEEGWNLIFGQELMKQMGVYHNSSKEKVFLYKTLGIALSATGDIGRVTQLLLHLLLHTDYTEEVQQKGVRWCLSYCAEGQLVAVLEALHSFEKEILEEKDLACFQIGQALPQPEKEHVMNTLLLLYSSMTIRVPQEQLMPHLVSEIVPRILHHYMTPNNSERASDAELVLSFAQSVSEISLSMQSKGNSTTFQLPQKRVLLDLLMNIVKTESLEVLVTPVCQQVMVALRHLRQVPEMLSPEENWKLAEACLSYVFALPPLRVAEGASQTLYTGTLTSLSELMETLLEPGAGENDFSDWFKQIFQLLGYWLVSEHEWERARAMQLGVHLLKTYCQRTNTSISQNQFSYLMALLGPFTYDTLGTIRHGAGNCIRLLLNIQGATNLHKPKVRVNQQRLYCIQRDLQSESTETMHTASLQLAKIVSCVLPVQGILTFLHTLLEQLRTVNSACDKAILLWFEMAVKERQPDLKDKVHNVVDIICSFWQYSEDSAQRHFLAQAICILAEHHRKAVCFSLLEQPLLQDKRIVSQAKKYQKALLKPLIQALHDNSSPELATESLHTLCNLCRCLGKWPADCTFQIVVSQACVHLQHADDAVRAAAFELLGELAKTVPLRFSKFYAKKVGGALAALMLHFHDPCPHVAQACQTAFIACAPFLGLCGLLKSTNSELLLVDLLDIQHSHLMDRICQQLAQRNPLLLETVMAEVAQYIGCNWEGIRLMACKLAGILVEKVETQHLGQFDVEQLLQALHSASRDPSTTVISAALEATHTIQQKWQESQTRLASGHQRRAVLLGWFFRRQPKRTLGAARPRPA